MTKTNVLFSFLIVILSCFLGGCTDVSKAKEVTGESQGSRDETDSDKAMVRHTTSDISVDISLVHSKNALNQPVLINFQINNNSNEEIMLEVGLDLKQSFLITAKRPDGNIVTIPKMRPSGLSRIIKINPSHNYSQVLILDEWIDFNEIGDYLLKGRLEVPVRSVDDNQIIFDPTFSIAIKIEPEDDRYLKNMIEATFETYKNSANSEAVEAAIVLSYFKDPIVVGYLGEVLRNKKISRPSIINALGKQTDKQSVDILINYISEEDEPESLAHARSILGLIERQTSDTEIKAFIRNRLKQVNEN